MVDQRKVLIFGGLALAGAAGLMALQNQKKTPAPTPGPAPAPGVRPPVVLPPTHWSFRTWLIAVLQANRADVLAGISSAAYRDVLGQFESEQWPDYWNRADIVANRTGAPTQDQWDNAVVQWLVEQASGFWKRADIQGAWFGYPPRHNDVFGQYLREQGSGLALPIPS